MNITDVDICNIALSRIGVDRTIASLTEQSKEARLCKRFYDFCLQDVLERVPWSFAVRAKPLALLATQELLPDWSYQYAMPTDAAAILEIVPAGDVSASTGYYTGGDCCGPWMPARKGAYAFRRAMSFDGTVPVILSNIADAYAVYTSRVTNTSAFTAMFASLVADRLAMELAMPLTVDPRWFQVCQQRFAAAFIDTASRDFEQEKPGPVMDPPSIRARG
jgi:hypothetical protein